MSADADMASVIADLQNTPIIEAGQCNPFAGARKLLGPGTVRATIATIRSMADALAERDATIASRDAEIARLKVDAERLDWVEANPTIAPVYARGYLRTPSAWLYLGPDQFNHKEADSLRAAIDAARAAIPSPDGAAG